MKKPTLLFLIVKMLKKAFSFLFKIMLVLIGREILQRQQADAKAKRLAQREAQQRMNEFLNVASHDLKTPLTSIKGNIQLMVRRIKKVVADDSNGSSNETQVLLEVRELLERTDQQLTRLTKVVHTLLESARSKASTLDLLLELCELDGLLHEVVQEQRHIPKTRVITLNTPPGNPILVMADTQRIKQVVHHYLSNAHKFSKLEHPIEVRLQSEGRVARVFVSDKGLGIPTHEQEHIWEQFYRVPSIEIQNGTEIGLGLGLHICHKIIEQHCGRVGVYSTQGSGSTFWFTLPLTTKEMHIL